MSGAETVKAAARTLDVFEAFVAARGPLSLTELSQRTGIPISSCHALVRTLHARGYVYFLNDRRKIYPTKRLSAIAQAIGRHDPLFERLAPILRRLADATGETVIIGKMQGDKVIYLDVFDGTHTVRFAAAPGDILPAHASAISKSTLGLKSEAELDDIIAKLTFSPFTEQTITDAATFRNDIVAGRERGYFLSRGETVAGVMGISIAQRVGDEIYGIGIAGPQQRLEAQLEAYLAALNEARRSIETIDESMRGTV